MSFNRQPNGQSYLYTVEEGKAHQNFPLIGIAYDQIKQKKLGTEMPILFRWTLYVMAPNQN